MPPLQGSEAKKSPGEIGLKNPKKVTARNSRVTGYLRKTVNSRSPAYGSGSYHVFLGAIT